MTDKYLVTGAAGFIGFHVSRALVSQGHDVLGIDCLSDYYDPLLKEARLRELVGLGQFRFVRGDIAASDAFLALVTGWKPDVVVHLAAQPGVRYSLLNPFAYSNANLTGSLSVLEACRRVGVRHLVYASSSSVYGMNRKVPFAVGDNVDHPVSLYAATKRANELMAHSYSHLFGVPTTGLRFFTVYGSWGRPDMAYSLFSKAILTGTPIDLFNHGRMSRDFTYIDDIVEGLLRVTRNAPAVGACSDTAAPYRLYNIGSSSPVALEEMVSILEDILGVRALRRYLPMQPGDVPTTFADVSDLERDVGYKPRTTLKAGLEVFLDWFRSYYAL